MPWRQLSLRTNSEQCEQIEDLLVELGAQAITLEDASGQALLEPGPGETPLWRELNLHALFDIDCDLSPVTETLFQQGLLGDTGQMRTKVIKDQVWERAWMERFQPMSFGERLWIYPHHIDVPERPNQIVVRLDPGLAFGSGTHPTTAMCLRWLDRTMLENRDIVDFGCGSGVLAIAAALCGARKVWCVDHEEQALMATRENAELNGVSDRILTCHPDELSPACADVVLANILAGVLCELSPMLLRLMKPKGSLVMSGMLHSQVDQVKAAYASMRWAQDQQEEWCMLCGESV